MFDPDDLATHHAIVRVVVKLAVNWYGIWATRRLVKIIEHIPKVKNVTYISGILMIMH